ncbi:MAG: ribonuclease III [Oscillospiraceae bacterium]|nr:ribonuclease III [Oscillospiraceae bacterium]
MEKEKIAQNTKHNKNLNNNKNDEKQVRNFAKKIGYEYKNISFLTTALTHSSYSNEMKSKGIKSECNERLEFLGDAVLSLITSEYIYLKLRDCKEGELTRIRATVVCEDSLFRFAESINLGAALFLGHGEIISNGRNRKSTLADAFEAVLGSIFLDGGLEAAKKYLFKFILKPIDDIVNEGDIKDYKSLLQQIIQQNNGEVLEYVLINESGPAHEKIFEVHAKLNNNIIGEGKGKSKKSAEQNAAKEAIILFGY